MSELISSRRNVLKSALGLAVAAGLPAGAFARGKSAAAVTATALNDRLLLVSGLGGNVLALRSGEDVGYAPVINNELGRGGQTLNAPLLAGNGGGPGVFGAGRPAGNDL